MFWSSGSSSSWCSVTVLIIIATLYGHIITGISGQLMFRDSPHNATSLLSHPTVLTCSVPDNPPDNIRWTINENEATVSDRLNISYNSTTGESQLTISSLQYTDNGAYQCQALSSGGSVLLSSNIGYITAIGPPVLRTPLEPITVPVGGVATFNCDVYSNPMLQSVRWVFNGVTIVSDGLRIVATNTQLIINSVQSEDEGSYSCTVTNPYGSLQSSAILTIENLPDLMIVTRPSRNVDVVEGNTVTITCTVEGGTPATLDWYRNGMELTENGSIGIAHTSMRSVVLTLRNVTSLDNGDHTCVGTIAVGDVMRASVEVNVLTRPQFTSQPDNITVNTGEQIRTGCVATGNPPPTISWYGPNNNPLMEITGNSNPDLGIASLSIAGRYSCVAINSVGQSVAEFYVFVRGPPVITPLATQIDVGVGSDVSVGCIVQGYPTPTVRWTRLSGDALPPNSYTIGNNLTITGITFTSGGTYQCTATNVCDRVCGTVVDTTTINVHEPPVVADAPVDVHTITGDTVRLQCGFTSTLPVSITWTREELPSRQIVTIVMNNRITINNTNNTVELIIHSVTSDDSGLYTCTGVTIAGTAIAAADVIVGTTPVFDTYPQDANLNIGDNIILNCSASGDPPPQITWEKTDQRTGVRMVLSGSDIVSLSNGDLPLVSVQQDDSGLYHCIADNQVDRVEATAVIKVQGPPLVQSITPTIIFAGNDAILTCNLIFDFPSASIQWSRSDGISTVAGRMNVIQNRSLIIVPANISDAVTYTCMATNQFGSDSYSAAITVHFQPTISLDILNYTHFIDGTARLPCPVSSNPPSTFQWRLGENMTELQGPRYEVDSIDGTLTITQLRIPDTNTYHCVATNYLGSDTAATTITVEGPSPENITVNTSSSTLLLVEWSESSVTTTDLTMYQVIFREEFDDETNATVLGQTNLGNRSVTLYGLRPFTEYRITVRGVYVVITQSGDVTLSNGLNATTTAVTAEDLPTGTPQNITTDSDVEYVDIFFKAPPEDSRNGIIIGYNIYYRPSVPDKFANVTIGGIYDDNGTNVTVANFTLAIFTPSNLNTTSHQYTLDGLNDDSSYDFFMEAFNSAGTGPNTTIFTVQTETAFPTTLVVVISSTVGGLAIITLIVVLIICCVFYCRKRRKSHEAEADRRTARNVKKLIISEPATDVPPDTTSSGKFSVENTDGDVIPLNPKVIKSEDRAPRPEPGETAVPVKRITFEDEQQSDRPVSGIYSEPADCLSKYDSETVTAKSTEEEIKVVDDAFKDITDKEPLYASIPESHKKAKKEKSLKSKDKKNDKKESKRLTITEETTLEDIDTSTLEGKHMHRMLDAASAGMF